ncbi:MAG: protein phosphatase 2C domain-containing protein [Phaeospirillum sp.]|nr:protein phosphatase 2C domain-containing protein [Phaeospirillum sp.]
MIAVESGAVASLQERARAGDGRVTKDDGYLLPRCRSEDTVLPQPPLAVSLEMVELLELIADGNGWPVVATCFGPPQDKSRNEDAALSAVISGAGTQKFIFAAVADGVSTRTFWSERTSRLACLVAFKEIRSMVVDGILDLPAAAPALRTRLAASIRKRLVDDRAVILRSKVTPPDWAPDLYAKHIDREEFWYNSTLLLCCLGPTSGVAFWVGDGGLKIVKKGRDGSGVIAANTYVKSTDDSEIHTYVSLSNDIAFSGGPIDYSDASAIDVFLASDGVDRTLQRDNPVEYEALSLESGSGVRDCLTQLWQRSGAEIDNYSLARLSWPVGNQFPPPKRVLRPSASAATLDGESVPSPIHAPSSDTAVAVAVVPKATPNKESVSASPLPSTPPQATPPQEKVRPNRVRGSGDGGTEATKGVTGGGVKSLPVILRLLKATKDIEQKHGSASEYPLNDAIVRSAYRLWVLRLFFPKEIEDTRILSKLYATDLGSFLDAPPEHLNQIVALYRKLTPKDKYLGKILEEMKDNSVFVMLRTQELMKLSFRDLLNILAAAA